MLGIVLGSMALGVLLGYPFGGILYAFVGKSAPFFIIAILTLITLALQLVYVDMRRSTTEVSTRAHLLRENAIFPFSNDLGERSEHQLFLFAFGCRYN